MPSRDVEINLIAHDRTGRATRSAARNLDQLARKTEKIKTQTIKTKVNVGTANTKKVEQEAKRLNNRLKRIFHKGGFNAASAFGQGFINALTFGQANIGSSGIARKLSPKFASVGITIGAVFAAKLVTTAATAITAGLSGVLALGFLAGPVVFLLKQQTKAAKLADQTQKKVATLRHTLAVAEAADARKTGRKGDTKGAKADRTARIKDLYKQLAAQTKIVRDNRRLAQGYLQLKKDAKSFITTISAPVKTPLAESLTAIGVGLDRLKAPVRAFTAALGPALAPFVKGVMQGLLNFVNALKPALPGIVAGFKQWGIELANIGGALGKALAGILSDPAKVVSAVKSISGTIQGLIGFLGILVDWLTSVDLAWSKWGSGFNVGTVIGKSAAVQNAIAAMAIGIISAIQKLLPAVASMVSFLGRAFVGIIEAWNALPFTKNIDTGPIKDFTKAFETEVPKWIVSLENYKQAAKQAQRKIKLQADAKDLQSKIAAMKAKLKTLPKSKQTEMKAKIERAEARLRKLQGEINPLHGKSVDIWIKTHRATYYSVHGNKGRVPTNPKGDKKPPAAGISWQAGMLDGGGMSRTGGPSAVNVAAPVVDTRVFIDSREIRSVARSTVLDENRRNAYRARVGRR